MQIIENLLVGLSASRMLFCSILLGFLLIGCGGGSDGEELEFVADDRANIVEFFGAEGNIYKPVADLKASGAGNLVVLLASKYSQQFDSCQIQRIDGSVADLFCLNSVPWTQVPFSCFSNGNRQTWRATFKCSQVAIVDVVCRSATEEVRFTVPEQNQAQVCSRFG